ncbi:hypothetical protein GCM10011578_070200 [Streptomyces fuscichromogenes]|uniref:Uncharacterized protein n=1 Tax=Streptomyces fuscichromogenes TaxID=1324013 RepID=A0A918CV62_9ACTN|nr:hypothetical protein GCM10011578_070200 [Streptomyces fuscichromogenes]
MGPGQATATAPVTIEIRPYSRCHIQEPPKRATGLLFTLRNLLALPLGGLPKNVRLLVPRHKETARSIALAGEHPEETRLQA